MCSSYARTAPSSCLRGRTYGSPVDDDVLAVAGEKGAAFWDDVRVDGEHIRVFTFAYGPGAAVQVARPLNEVDESLRRIGCFCLRSQPAEWSSRPAWGSWSREPPSCLCASSRRPWSA